MDGTLSVINLQTGVGRKLITFSTIDVQWRNLFCSSSEFRTKFQEETTLISEISVPKLPYYIVSDEVEETSVLKTSSILNRTPSCDRHTDRHRATAYTALAQRLAGNVKHCILQRNHEVHCTGT